MKRGFNRYDNSEEGADDSGSEQSHQPTPTQQPLNYNFMNQFANFSPGSGFS